MLSQKVIWRCAMTKICISFVGQKWKKYIKNPPQNEKKIVLPQMPPKVIWGSPMTKIYIFWGPNYLPHATTNTAAYKCIFLFCNTFLPSWKAVLVVLQTWRVCNVCNTLKSRVLFCCCFFVVFLPTLLIYYHVATGRRLLFCPICPQKSFVGLPWPFAKFAYLWGQKCPFWG